MRLQKISTTLTTLYSKLAGDANQYIPLYTLPDDLFLAIWDHLPPYDRFHLPMVSRRFRDVALASHRLWRFIDITNGAPTDKLETLLARTGAAGLHLYAYDHREETPEDVPASEPTQSPSARSRIQILDDVLVRCTVLAGTIKARPFRGFVLSAQSPSLPLEILGCMAPRLRSLWLADVVHYGSSDTYGIPFPLFGGQTQQLLHVHFSYFAPQWDDPLYRNLTYLRLEELISQPSISRILDILRGCPNLEHLFLRSVLSARSDNEHSLPSIALPFLRHLSLVKESPENIIALLDQLHTNPCLRFGISSKTLHGLTLRYFREDTPWALISRADELIISAPGFEGSRWSVMSKQAGATLTHFCLDLDLDGEPILVDSIQQSNLLFNRIKRLRFQGVFYDPLTTQSLIALFPCLEVLETVNFGAADAIVELGDEMQLIGLTMLEIVGKELCPSLRELRITLAEYNEIEDLIQWLGHRNDFGYQPLRHAAVYADQPLNLADRKRMDQLVENIQWRERRLLWVFRERSGYIRVKAETRHDRNDQDEDPLDRESERAMSVPPTGVLYLGEDPPDYFSIPE